MYGVSSFPDMAPRHYLSFSAFVRLARAHLIPPQAGHDVVERHERQRADKVEPAELRVDPHPPGSGAVRRHQGHQAKQAVPTIEQPIG